MTVVAWDGKTLAADRLGVMVGGVKSVTSKIFRLPNGTILAGTGCCSGLIALRSWFAEGAIPEHWPKSQDDDDTLASLMVVHPDGRCVTYESLPLPILVEDPFMAWGSGGPLALGAMAMGADARQAVEVACRYSTTCGLGFDAFDVLPGRL